MDEAVIRIVLQDVGAAAAGAAPGAGSPASPTFGTSQSISLASEQFRKLTDYLQELPEIRKAVGWTAEILSGVRQAQTDRVAPGLMTQAGVAGTVAGAPSEGFAGLQREMAGVAESIRQLTKQQATTLAPTQPPPPPPSYAPRFVPPEASTVTPSDTLLKQIVERLPEPSPKGPPELTEPEALAVAGMELGGPAAGLKLEADEPGRPRGQVGGEFGQAAIDFVAAHFADLKFRESFTGVENEEERRKRAEEFAQGFIDALEGKKPPEPVWNPAWLGAGPFGPEALPVIDTEPEDTDVLQGLPPKKTMIPPMAAPGGKETQLMPPGTGVTTQLMPPPEPPLEFTMPEADPSAWGFGYQPLPAPPSAPPAPPPPAPPPAPHPGWGSHTWETWPAKMGGPGPHHGKGWNLPASATNPAGYTPEQLQQMENVGARAPSTDDTDDPISNPEYMDFLRRLYEGGEPPPNFARGGWVGGAPKHMAGGGKITTDDVTKAIDTKPGLLGRLLGGEKEPLKKLLREEAISVKGAPRDEVYNEPSSALLLNKTQISWGQTDAERTLDTASKLIEGFDKYRDQIPNALTRHTKRFHISSFESPSTEYWQKEYRDPNFRIAGLGGQGSVGLFPLAGENSIENLVGLASHEMAHNLSEFVSQTYPGLFNYSGYMKAAAAEPPVSKYARDVIESEAPNAFDEDFAESARMFVQARDLMFERFPQRATALQTMFNALDAAYARENPGQPLRRFSYGGVVYAAAGGDITDHPGGPIGTDTVPAWLTPGEFVVPADAAAANKDTLEMMRSGGVVHMQGGGKVTQLMPPQPYESGEPTEEQLASAIEDYRKSLEDNTAAIGDLVEVIEDIPIGVEIPDTPDVNIPSIKGVGGKDGLGGSITNISKMITGGMKGDLSSIMGSMGGGASAMAGPVGAVKAALDAVNESVISGIKGTVAGISKVANAIADPSADPSVPLGKIGDAASDAGEKLAKVSPALGWMVIGIGEATSALSSFMGGLDKTVERYGEYNPQIAQAQAIAEIRHTMGDIRRASEVSGALSEYIVAKTDLQQKFEDIKVKMLTKIVPIATRILEVIEAMIPSGQGIETAIGQLGGPLVTLSIVASEMAALLQRNTTPDIQDPTEQLMDPRFMTTSGMNDALGRPGWVPDR